MSRSRLWRGAAVLGLSLALVTPLSAANAAPARLTPATPHRDPSVAGKPVVVLPPATGSSETNQVRPGLKVTWPEAGAAEVSLADAKSTASVRAGGLPVSVAADATPAKIRVGIRDRAVADKAGIRGVLLDVRRADGVDTAVSAALSVDYSGFRHAYGGDWSARLQMVSLPGCVTVTPDKPECRTATPLRTRNDVAAGTLSASVTAGKSEAVYALEAPPEGSTGDYKATELSPAGKWTVSAQSGNFTWSYPLRTPQVPGELAPQLEMSYSSGATDGRVASTNNQPGWIGEGWSLWSGFIERSYKTCADDGVLPKTGDLCWETENATMSLRGHSTELVWDGEKKLWRPKNDDGTRVEHLFGAPNGDDNGEHWRITTTDGVQYYFGLNRAANNSTWSVPVFGNEDGEPCHKATYEASWCDQAWRWNLDYVVDPNDNSMSYFYAPEKNSYGRNSAKSKSEYTRGGTLGRIEYGTRKDKESGSSAPAKIVFDVQDRCIAGGSCGTRDGTNWPDVPWDQNCEAATCPKNVAPTFWSTKRLAGVITQFWDGAQYRDVDRWAFGHSYPVTGDGTSASLWLASIKHTGVVGLKPAEVPVITFVGEARANRINVEEDGLPPMNKFRMQHINTESGGTISPNYNGADCSATNKPTPETNGTRCFPVRWTPNLAAPVKDWFVKHTVSQVVQIDRVARNPSQVTSYDYEGDGAWAYDDDPLRKPEHRTWSQWRGYEKVLVRKGDPKDTFNPQSATRYHYFRGMNGDRKTEAGGTKPVQIKDSHKVAWDDDVQLAGLVREETVYNGLGGPVVSETINDPWSHGPTATGGPLKAYMVNLAKTVTRTALAGGGWRTTQTKTSYDTTYGMVTEVENLGDIARADDDQCIRTTYARNTATWLVDRQRRVEKSGLPCAAGEAKVAADIISDTRISFDDKAFDVPPTRGNATKTEEINELAGTERKYVVDKSSTYDEYGRVVSTANALGHTTKTDYVPATGFPRTVTETNPAGHAKKTTYDPARNQPTLIIDANDKRTELTYDGLGRLEGVWLPGRNKLGGLGPNIRYTYTINSNKVSALTTETLRPNNNYSTAHALFDGFLRSRQVQQPTAVGGRVLSDTFFDSRGLESKKNTAYHNIDAPNKELLVVGDEAVPSQTVTTRDGVERETESALLSLGSKKWSTTTKHNGDNTEVRPPLGGTPTIMYTDVAGRTTEMRQLTSGGPNPTYQPTKYTYTKAGHLETMVDAAGNTWRNDYDLRGRKIRASDPDKGITTTRYDHAGQVTSTTDARNKTVVHLYDNLGRRTETHENATDGPLLAKWTFDLRAKGKQDSSTRYVGAAEYKNEVLEFDAGYRPTKETLTIPAVEGALGRAYTTVRTYYVDGSAKTVALPDVGDLGTETLAYTYDDLGLARTTSGIDKYVTQSVYTSLGEPTQFRFGGEVENAVWNTNYYDVATRRVTENVTQRERMGSLEVGRTKYKHDPIGNVTQIKETAPGVTDDNQCFTYDAVRQLKEAWTATNECEGAPGGTIGGPAPYWTSYKYDLAGNRTEVENHGGGVLAAKTSGKRTTTFPAPGQPRPHAPVSVKKGDGFTAADATYEHDATGNVTRRPGPTGSQTLTWNAEGHMTEVKENDKTSRYVYDASGARLIAEDPSGTTLYLGDTEVRVAGGPAARASKPTATRYYTHGKTPVATRTSDGTLRYVMGDSRNTVGLAVDATSLEPTRRRFEPFGGARGTAPQNWQGQRGYIGGVKDDSSGLTRLGARDYDPATGTFVSTDPIMDIENPQHLNPYAYSTNNPTSMSDPSGLARVDDGVEWAEYERRKQQSAQASKDAGRAPINRGSTTNNAQQEFFFGPPPPGSKRVVIKKIRQLGEDHGIIVSRFFIKNKLAALGMLFGDNRDFTTALDAGYRFLIAWDTWTGDVSITFSETISTSVPSAEFPFPDLGDGDGPANTHTPPRDIVIGDGGYWKNSVTFDNSHGELFAFGYKAMNADLPCCQTDGVVMLSANKAGVGATVIGEHYPDVEIIQYRNEGARLIGSDPMSEAAELAAIGDNFGDRKKSWSVPN